MSQQQTGPPTTSPPTRTASPWVIGFAIFAGIILIVSGIFQAVEGIVGIARGSFYVITPRNIFEFSTTAWGWTHLIIGVLLVVVGIAVLNGYLWARIIGIVLASISAITNFLFIPHYPVWSLVIITLDILAIWGMSGYSREVAERNSVRY